MEPVQAAAHPPVLGRRTLLAGGLATALVGRAGSSANAAPVLKTTVATLTAAEPFHIAHRGGGRNWPAMTAYAYAQAAKVPNVHALEISVCITSDDVLVCSHNKTTTSMTGVPYTIIEETWETLSSLRVSPRYTTDPDQPSRPFTRFEDVVERYIDSHVLFVEPKINAAGDRLMERMAALGQPERVVWKQPVNSKRFAAAKDRGFTTWGYVLDEPAHTGKNLARYAASEHVDLLGAYDGESDDFASAVVAAADENDKLTIMWEISTVQERQRALRLGCAGLMTSDVLNVVNSPL
jgi:glycerophosphoryl diester phosphodiesterase